MSWSAACWWLKRSMWGTIKASLNSGCEILLTKDMSQNQLDLDENSISPVENLREPWIKLTFNPLIPLSCLHVDKNTTPSIQHNYPEFALDLHIIHIQFTFNSSLVLYHLPWRLVEGNHLSSNVIMHRQCFHSILQTVK